LFLQDRIFSAGLQEDSLAQQRVDLARMAQTSTIEVDLFEPGELPPGAAPVPPGPEARFRESLAYAHRGIAAQVARAATVAAYAAVYAPIWIPILLITIAVLIWLIRFVISRRERMLTAAHRAAAAIGSAFRTVLLARNRPILPTRRPDENRE